MRNRDICISVPTYRSVNKCVHYTSVLLPRRTRHVKYTLEDTRSLGVEQNGGACKYQQPQLRYFECVISRIKTSLFFCVSRLKKKTKKI